MKRTKINKCIRVLEHDSAVPVSEEEIIKFEKDMGLRFGDQYRAFLKNYGCLSLEGIEFYGICGKNNSIPSAIYCTKQMRSDYKFPENLIVIYDRGDGVLYCIDGLDQVYKYDNGQISATKDDFESFVCNRIKANINN